MDWVKSRNHSHASQNSTIINACVVLCSAELPPCPPVCLLLKMQQTNKKHIAKEHTFTFVTHKIIEA